jgi:hypothetical protein
MTALGCMGVYDEDVIRPSVHAWQGSSKPKEDAAALVDGISLMTTPSQSSMSFPECKTGGDGSTPCNCYTDIVTCGKRPKNKVAVVHMTNATLLRSRMTPKRHVRF